MWLSADFRLLQTSHNMLLCCWARPAGSCWKTHRTFLSRCTYTWCTNPSAICDARTCFCTCCCSTDCLLLNKQSNVAYADAESTLADDKTPSASDKPSKVKKQKQKGVYAPQRLLSAVCKVAPHFKVTNKMMLEPEPHCSLCANLPFPGYD